MDAWLQRCLTCQHSVRHRRIEDTECTAKSCKYTPKLVTPSKGVSEYICIRCKSKFNDTTKYPTSYMKFGNTEYCRTCLLDIIDTCNEINKYKAIFERCERK